MELAEIVAYIRNNDLISDEKLSELRDVARKKAKERNLANQKELDRIYGQYSSLYVPSNTTKPDKTAKTAIKNVTRKDE